MMDVQISNQPTTIASLAKTIHYSLQKLAYLLQTTTPQTWDTSHISFSKIQDELGRFKVWIANIGAIQKGQSSLDFRLRDANLVAARVVRILEDLIFSIKEVLDIIEGRRLPRQTEGFDYGSDEFSEGSSAEGLESESGIGSLSEHSEMGPRNEVQQLYLSIVNSITSLFKLSMLIRSTPARSRESKANKMANRFNHFYDIGHVLDKFPITKKGDRAWLAERLGKANTLRRQYFRYCEDRRERLSKESKEVSQMEDVVAGKKHLTSLSEFERTSSTEPKAPQDQVDAHRIYGGGSRAPSSRAAQSTLTAASTFVSKQLEIAEKMAEEMSEEMSEYTQTSAAVSSLNDKGAGKLKIPPPPREMDDQPFFECSYCFTIQDRRIGGSKSRWRKHVFRDLEPYICTFKGCNAKPFSSRHAWFNHELTQHRKYWYCPRCEISHTTAESMEQHLRRKKCTPFAEADLSILLERYERAVNQIPALDCPLCEDWCGPRNTKLKSDENFPKETTTIFVTPREFEKHLGRHLEHLALFSLPREYKDGEKEGSEFVSDRPELEDEDEDESEDELEGNLSVDSDGSEFDEDGGSARMVRFVLKPFTSLGVTEKNALQMQSVYWKLLQTLEMLAMAVDSVTDTNGILDFKTRLEGITFSGEYILPRLAGNAEHGIDQAVTLLLKNGATLDQRDAYGRTALELAVACGNSKTVQVLNDFKTVGLTSSEVELEDEQELVVGVRRCIMKFRRMEEALRHGFLTNHWESQLISAIRHKNINLVQIALDQGADPEFKAAQDDQTPVLLARVVEGTGTQDSTFNTTSLKYGPMTQILLERLSQDTQRPISELESELEQSFLASRSKQTSEKQTGFYQPIAPLVMGPFRSISLRESQMSALQNDIEYQQNIERLEATALAIDAVNSSSSATVDEANENGLTLLMRFAKIGSHPAITLLLQRGADPNLVDKLGRSASDIALAEGNEGVAALITTYTPRPIIAEEEEQDLMGTIRQWLERYRQTEEALRLGILNNDFNSYLLSAIESKNEALVRILLKRGADPEYQAYNGQTPIQSSKMVEGGEDSGQSYGKITRMLFESIHERTGKAMSEIEEEYGAAPWIDNLTDFSEVQPETDCQFSTTCAGCSEPLVDKSPRYKCISCIDVNHCQHCNKERKTCSNSPEPHGFVRIMHTESIEAPPGQSCDGCGETVGERAWYRCYEEGCGKAYCVLCIRRASSRWQHHSEHRYVAFCGSYDENQRKELEQTAAKLYNEPGSVLGTPDSTADHRGILQQVFESVLATVMDLKDDTGRLRSEAFYDLPSKDESPEFHQLVTSPISLKMIQERTRNQEYHDIAGFKADFLLVFANAKHYLDNRSGASVPFNGDDVNVLQTEFESILETELKKYSISANTPPANKVEVPSPDFENTDTPTRPTVEDPEKSVPKANPKFEIGRLGRELYEASERGDEKEVRRLIEDGADANARCEGKRYYVYAFQAATYNEHVGIVKLLIDNGADVNAVGGGFYGTALQAAAHIGSEKLVKLLIDNGADVNVVCGNLGTALQAAALGESEKLVKLLIDNGADVNVVCGDLGTVLHVAAYGENEKLVKLLIDNGADVNVVGGQHGTALQAAASRGSEKLVKLLIDHGANPSVVSADATSSACGEFGSALHAAVYARSENIVKLLLQSGADIHSLSEEYGTLLQTAALRGNVALVNFFLERGLDINAVGGKYGSALQAAALGLEIVDREGLRNSGEAREKRKEIIRFLIEKGADVNFVGGEYGSALHAAAYGSSLEGATVLVDSGAYLNAVNESYGTVLQTAALTGSVDLVQFFLEKGLDINAVGGKYGSALQAAALGLRISDRVGSVDSHEVSKKRENIIRFLIEKGADVNFVGGEYGSALHAAAYGGNLEGATVLVDSGAYLNAVNVRYGTVLQTAALTGSVELVQFFLEKGLDINAVGGRYGSALQAAAFGKEIKDSYIYSARHREWRNPDQRRSDIIQFLIENGADVNARGGEYGCPLRAARAGDNEEAIEILVEHGARDIEEETTTGEESKPQTELASEADGGAKA